MSEIFLTDLVKVQPNLIVHLKKVCQIVLDYCRIKKDVSVVLAGDALLHKLNFEYRQKNKTTDVLSFGDWNEKDFLGEMIISVPQARRQAKLYKVEVKEELARLVIHGLLHLKGFDHEKSKKDEEKMFSLQDRLLKKIQN